MGVTEHWYLDPRNVIRYNAYDSMAHDLASARKRVASRIARHREWFVEPKFLFLGRVAAQAGPKDIRQLGWCQIQDDMMVIPHPSGVNRWYNLPSNVRLVEESLREFLGRS